MQQNKKRKILSGLMALVMILVMMNASWVSASSDYEEPIEAVWETTEEVTADSSGEAEESIAEDSEPETDGITAAEVSLIEDGESVDEEETSAEIAGLMEEPEDMTASFLLLSDEELLPEEEVLEEETGSETAQLMMLSEGEKALTVSEYTLYANSSSSQSTYPLEGSYSGYSYHRWTSSDTKTVGLDNNRQSTATAFWKSRAGTANITHEVSRDGRNWTTVDIYHLTIISSSGNNRAAVFNFKVENADIIGYYYNITGNNPPTGNQLDLPLKEDGTGLYTMPYTWNGQKNYWYFFVKPHDGYLITGLNAGISGTAGDIFDINASSYSYRTSGGGTVSIESFPKIHDHANELKKDGYVGVFGYSRVNSSSTVIAPITVKGYKPSLNVQATTEANNVMPGQTIDLNVTLTPESGNRANGKRSHQYCSNQ